MAEIFTNFLSVSNKTGDKIIVPSGVLLNNTENVLNGSQSMGISVREENSVAQIHSLYITVVNSDRVQGNNRYNENLFKHIDLYIGDVNNSQTKVYIAYDTEIVPGSSFYIEKNITLTQSQYLAMNIPAGAGGNDNNLNVSVVASAVLFTEEEN